MFIEPTITWVPSGFSVYIWLNTKIVFKKNYRYCAIRKRKSEIKNDKILMKLLVSAKFQRIYHKIYIISDSRTPGGITPSERITLRDTTPPTAIAPLGNIMPYS